MKAKKGSNKVVQGKGFDVSWACGHGQHALDKHDRDTMRLDYLTKCHVSFSCFSYLDRRRGPCLYKTFASLFLFLFFIFARYLASSYFNLVLPHAKDVLATILIGSHVLLGLSREVV